MKLGAFLATYHRAEALRNTIGILLTQTRPPDLLYIVDNANDRKTSEMISQIHDERIVYEAMPYNMGSAGGASRGVDWLAQNNCDLIYLGDDDDPPVTGDTLEKVVQLLTSGDEKVAGAAAVGASWNWAKGEPVRFQDGELNGVMDVDVVGGNQHLIIRKQIVDEVGIPDARLFFGNWDFEYCLRIRNKGFRILIDGSLMKEYRELKGRLNLQRPILARRSDSALWRDYYITRNSIFMMRNTFDRKDVARKKAWKSLMKAIGSWKNGPGYGLKYSLLQLRGIADGFSGHLGSRIIPTPGKGKTLVQNFRDN